MGKGQHHAGARYARTLFNIGTLGSLTDGQLLVWIRALAEGARPERVLQLGGGDTGGELPVGLADGKQIILSLSSRDESRKAWVHETFRINADGSGRQPLKVPDLDGVQDWSPDGAWIVTTSSRNAKIGWQPCMMRPDGKNSKGVRNLFYVSSKGSEIFYRLWYLPLFCFGSLPLFLPPFLMESHTEIARSRG